ncbi:hypothetical protein AAMO2058_000103500 [Amorphochlora amoebiformis]
MAAVGYAIWLLLGGSEVVAGRYVVRKLPTRIFRSLESPLRCSALSMSHRKGPNLRRIMPGRAGLPITTPRCSTPEDSTSLQLNTDLLQALETVEAPAMVRLGGPVDLAQGGMVKEAIGEPNLGIASVLIDLPLPIDTLTKRSLQEKVERALQKVEWVKNPLVVITSPEGTPAQPSAPVSPFAAMEKDAASLGGRRGGLARVKKVIAVASCKGGVGKSTTAVNLAFALQNLGESVGIVDTDLYGPSLPTMVHAENPDVKFGDSGNEIEPLEAHGVKLMSMGYINPTDSMVVRGARAAPLVEQLLTRTQWGELDYLVIDMPPGTGDIQLTLAQSLQIDAAVIVTTPQRLSFADVVKGVEMFDKVGIPSIAVVENMASFRDNSLVEQAAIFADKNQLSTSAKSELLTLVGTPREIFGPGHRQRLSDMWGIENTYAMPMEPDISTAGDSGTPYVLSNPQREASELYLAIARDVRREVERLAENRKMRPQVTYDAVREVVVSILENGTESIIDPVELRRRCRSPTNVKELITDGVRPLDIFPMGNYAVQIVWNDGHNSLMPYRSFIDGWEETNRNDAALTGATAPV